MKHYIIIEVREPVDAAGNANPNARMLDAGRVRKVLHKFYEDAGIDASDMIVRGDRTYNFYGVRNPTKMLSDLLDKLVPTRRDRG